MLICIGDRIRDSLENKISTSQLSQAINSPSVPTAVGKCKISMFNIVVLLFSGLVILLNV